MSLTSILKAKDTKSREVQKIIRALIPPKNEFYTFSGAKPFDTSIPPTAPLTAENTKHASIIGIAIELLAKYYIGHYAKGTRLKYAARTCGKRNQSLEQLWHVLDEKEYKAIEVHYGSAQDAIAQFCTNKTSDISSVILASIVSAKMDILSRSHVIPDNPVHYFTSPPRESVIYDIQTQFEGFQSIFHEKRLIKRHIEEIDFHPRFGSASLSIGGADADLFLNGTLFEFKSSWKKGYNWLDVAQVLGYALLGDISAINFEKDIEDVGVFPLYTFYQKIERIGLYRTRYNDADFLDLSSISKDQWREARDQLMILLDL